ncbi:MAG: hypothetical protein GEU79_06130 [Acidimicrobiia bacterium]|nr:hypothetical protein [Acidimicrobiia bacterium]
MEPTLWSVMRVLESAQCPSLRGKQESQLLKEQPQVTIDSDGPFICDIERTRDSKGCLRLAIIVHGKLPLSENPVNIKVTHEDGEMVGTGYLLRAKGRDNEHTTEILVIG